MVDSTNHLDWEERLQDWIDRDLDPPDAATVEAHTAACGACLASLTAFRTVDASLAEALVAPALSANFDREVLERIERVSRADRSTLRARLERQWHAEMETFARQWRTALRTTILNLLLATTLLVAVQAHLLQFQFVHLQNRIGPSQIEPSFSLILMKWSRSRQG